MREFILNMFTPLNEGMTLEKIKKEIAVRVNQASLLTTLKTLELDGKIYCDNNMYYVFPSNFFVGSLIGIEEGKSITVRYNKKDIKLHTKDKGFKYTDKIIFKKKDNDKYSFIKKIDIPKEKNYTFEEEILDIFYPLHKGINLNSIIKRCGKKVDISEITNTLQELELEGHLYYDNYTDKYYPMPRDFIITKIEVTKKGILQIEDNNKIKYLNAEDVKGVLPFDTVMLKRDGKRYKLVKVLKRHNPKIVCEVTDKGVKVVGANDFYVNIDKEVLKKENFLIGTRIMVNIGVSEINGVYDAEYIETIGHRNDLNIELESIAYNNGFIIKYTEEELEQLKSIPDHVSEKDKIGRIDLTGEKIFTIDGSHTKDIDDAIGIKKLDNGNYELIVAIAAVASYIPISSPLWQRAEKNTTSLYMIDSVSHMLHPHVSNGICSLNPGVERLAKAFTMEISPSGKVIDFRIDDAVIKSRKQMTYEDVNKILEENIVPDGYEDYVYELLMMDELSHILTSRRKEKGSIDFDSKEIRFILDEEKNIVDVVTVKQGPGEKLIENFMVTTNEEVAEFMLNLGITFIYRNHEAPIDEKVIETIDLIKSLGYHIEKLKNTDNPEIIQRIIQSISAKEEFFILSSLLLRSMKRAYFSTENIGHYALASKAYSQTTSPIRRLGDLIIQYILNNLDEILHPDYDFDALKEYVSKICERASTMERCADKAEYEANKLFMVDYCAQKPEREYVAFIQEFTPHYAIVKTTELIEGIVYFEDINEGNYTYSPQSKWLVNTKTKEHITIGSKLILTLKDYNREYRTIYFNGKSLNRVSQETLKRVRK